jgi:hypothetical protein
MVNESDIEKCPFGRLVFAVVVTHAAFDPFPPEEMRCA